VDRPLDLDNDETLVKKFQNGHEGSFDKLVLKYGQKIMNLAYRYMGNRDDAEDAAQEIFIKVHHKLSSFNFSARFTTWLYRVAVNTCIDLLRKDRRSRETSEYHDQSMGFQEGEPERTILMEERVRKIEEALAQLPEKERMVVLLADMENKSMKEMSTILSMREGTVKSTLYRARKRLRNLLRDLYNEMQ
jgi:RNA polymerase sigma-70 factor, ECF subfamily